MECLRGRHRGGRQFYFILAVLRTLFSCSKMSLFCLKTCTPCEVNPLKHSLNFVADIGEKTQRNLGETFSRFLSFDFQEKWPQEISQKSLQRFHEGRNKIHSLRDSGSGGPKYLYNTSRQAPIFLRNLCRFAHVTVTTCLRQFTTTANYQAHFRGQT